MILPNVLAFIASITIIGIALLRLGREPIPALFLGMFTIGGPVKALFYDLDWLKKPLDLYPFSGTAFNGLYALLDTMLVVTFIVLWCYRFHFSSDSFWRLCDRMWPAASVIFILYSLSFLKVTLSGLSDLSMAHDPRAGQAITLDPFQSFISSAVFFWSFSAAILLVKIRSWAIRVPLGLLFAIEVVLGNNVGRSGLVGFVLVMLLAFWERMRMRRLIPALLTIAVVAGTLRVATRGEGTTFSRDVLLQQVFADLQFHDQTVSYYDRFDGIALIQPRSTAFFESFVYGFMPRFLFPDKPATYGNEDVERILCPVVQNSVRTLESKGTSAGFFPVSLWTEMFADFGLPLGIVGFLGLALLLNRMLRWSHKSDTMYLLTMIIVTSPVGFFRGGSNWLMLACKGVVLFTALHVVIARLIPWWHQDEPGRKPPPRSPSEEGPRSAIAVESPGYSKR